MRMKPRADFGGQTNLVLKWKGAQQELIKTEGDLGDI